MTILGANKFKMPTTMRVEKAGAQDKTSLAQRRVMSGLQKSSVPSNPNLQPLGSRLGREKDTEPATHMKPLRKADNWAKKVIPTPHKGNSGLERPTTTPKDAKGELKRPVMSPPSKLQQPKAASLNNVNAAGPVPPKVGTGGPFIIDNDDWMVWEPVMTEAREKFGVKLLSKNHLERVMNDKIKVGERKITVGTATMRSKGTMAVSFDITGGVNKRFRLLEAARMPADDTGQVVTRTNIRHKEMGAKCGLWTAFSQERGEIIPCCPTMGKQMLNKPVHEMSKMEQGLLVQTFKDQVNKLRTRTEEYKLLSDDATRANKRLAAQCARLLDMNHDLSQEIEVRNQGVKRSSDDELDSDGDDDSDSDKRRRVE